MQHRRLVRARDLAAFSDALVTLAIGGAPAGGAPPRGHRADARVGRIAAPDDRVPARRLRGAPRSLLPDILTRAELFEHLLAALPGRPRLLTRVEREVLLERAARHTSKRRRMGSAPFPSAPGPRAAMLDFYDELRRRQRTARRMAGALFKQLKGERGTDRGSDSADSSDVFSRIHVSRLRTRSWPASGGWTNTSCAPRCSPSSRRCRTTIWWLRVADQPSDPSRARGRRTSICSAGCSSWRSSTSSSRTKRTTPASARRSNRNCPASTRTGGPRSFRRPVLVRPAAGGADASCVVSRDREEELRDVARAIRARAAQTGGVLRERTRDRVPSAAAVSVSGAAGADRSARAVSGVRRAAAGGRALCGAARYRHDRGAHGRHARVVG